MNLLTPKLAVFGLGIPELIVIVIVLGMLAAPIVIVIWLLVRRPSDSSQPAGVPPPGLPPPIGMKKCPDCAEVVQPDARVCKHCGFRFDAQPRSEA